MRTNVALTQYIIRGKGEPDRLVGGLEMSIRISKANTMMQAALSWWSVCLDLIMGNTQTAGRGIRYKVVVW